MGKEPGGFFLPPYEWYNDSIAAWTKELGIQLINFTPGTSSNADYTTPDMKNYRSSQNILQSIKKHKGLNGFILLLHIGTNPSRKDKFYHQLPALLTYLKESNYTIVTIEDLLKH
jgi:peptidoglycan/xylan/chitin deacetylase (PgdA/CDA1 family)